MINPDKLPDIRPDRRRFWGLRFLSWLLTVSGLALVIGGASHGLLAYYATKNGAEMERIYQALAYVAAAVSIGLLLSGVGQAFRVVLAIEENMRLIAFHTRPRAKQPEDNRERRVSTAASERMRL